MRKPIGVFDLDGTFVRSSLLIEIVRGLVREGVFPPLAERELESLYCAWRQRQGSFRDYLMKVVEVFYRRIRGCSIFDVKYVGELVAQEQREQVYVFTRGLVQRLRSSHRLVAISGSPDIVTGPFATGWGFERVYSSGLLEVDGVYTGERTPAMGVSFDISEFKRDLLRKAMIELDATMVGSVGVGDTESDIPLLEMVESPIAFNPNLELAREARARGWEMVYERKNAIIHLKDGRYEIDDL